MNTIKSIIALYRVSTQAQGASGLGLEGQQASVERYAAANGLKILATYIEVESGRVRFRPQLQAALLHAKRARCGLCVAKLDRLGRHAASLLLLAESGIPLIVVDNPSISQSHLMLGVLAVIAENEAKAISDRTKAALAAKKARGFALGSARPGHWDGREHRRLEGGRKGRERAAVVCMQLARQARREVAPIIMGMRSEGLTLAAIAERLNAEGWTTRRGKPWEVRYVSKFLKAFDKDGGRP